VAAFISSDKEVLDDAVYAAGIPPQREERIAPYLLLATESMPEGVSPLFHSIFLMIEDYIRGALPARMTVAPDPNITGRALTPAPKRAPQSCPYVDVRLQEQ